MLYKTQDIEILSKEQYDSYEQAYGTISHLVTERLNALKDEHADENFHLISMQIIQHEVVPLRIDTTDPIPGYTIRYKMKVRLLVTYELSDRTE